MTRSKSPIYAWREAHAAIDGKVRADGSEALVAAWQVAQAIIEAQARAAYPRGASARCAGQARNAARTGPGGSWGSREAEETRRRDMRTPVGFDHWDAATPKS
jgi:hypothetical protein